MARVILGLKRGDGIVADHRSLNTLDNRRSNCARLPEVKINTTEGKAATIPPAIKAYTVSGTALTSRRYVLMDAFTTWGLRPPLRQHIGFIVMQQSAYMVSSRGQRESSRYLPPLLS